MVDKLSIDRVPILGGMLVREDAILEPSENGSDNCSPPLWKDPPACETQVVISGVDVNESRQDVICVSALKREASSTIILSGCSRKLPESRKRVLERY